MAANSTDSASHDSATAVIQVCSIAVYFNNT
ncbi:hypothetical protein E2C01_086248 [Portunus trituberculatus]|uniref:Uncharacterized protein n=1 Tax=Portunus trituberculatus TaxID=210409 RepID=A0A5B7JFU3_PORTR|nr:hypothetical protein [Portunus trituberculatus]